MACSCTIAEGGTKGLTAGVAVAAVVVILAVERLRASAVTIGALDWELTTVGSEKEAVPVSVLRHHGLPSDSNCLTQTGAGAGMWRERPPKVYRSVPPLGVGTSRHGDDELEERDGDFFFPGVIGGVNGVSSSFMPKTVGEEAADDSRFTLIGALGEVADGSRFTLIGALGEVSLAGRGILLRLRDPRQESPRGRDRNSGA